MFVITKALNLVRKNYCRDSICYSILSCMESTSIVSHSFLIYFSFQFMGLLADFRQFLALIAPCTPQHTLLWFLFSPKLNPTLQPYNHAACTKIASALLQSSNTSSRSNTRTRMMLLCRCSRNAAAVVGHRLYKEIRKVQLKKAKMKGSHVPNSATYM